MYKAGDIRWTITSATTGQNLEVSDSTTAYFSRIADLKLKNPTMIGFGISSKETFDKACNYANGAIIGSAFVKSLDPTDVKGSVKEFMQKFKP